MNSFEQGPIVPDELTDLLDDPTVQAAQEDWQDWTLRDVHKAMPEPTATEYGRAVVLEPEGDWDGTTTVLATPFQQAWKPSMFIRAAYAQQAVAPESRMVILPNNSVTDTYYHFERPELGQLSSGNLTPLFEHQARVLEALGVEGKVMLSGYSMGALTAIGLAKVCSERLAVVSVNADEAPTGGREPKALNKDFMTSGGWGEQRAAIADARVPALSEALKTRRLAFDYARFGTASLLSMVGLRPVNKALAEGMARVDFGALLLEARAQFPEAIIKLGRVVDSRMVQLERVPQAAADIREYSGAGAHKHTTGDNVVAHALMMLDAQRLERNAA